MQGMDLFSDGKSHFETVFSLSWSWSHCLGLGLGLNVLV